MNSEFSAAFFSENRSKLRRLFRGTAPIILPANGQVQRSGDAAYRFRQDANFWYFTGLDTPGAVLVIDKDREYLILEPIVKFADIEKGAVSIDSLRNRSGITEILDDSGGWKRLAGRLKRAKYAAVLPTPQTYIKELGFYTNPARANVVSRIKETNPEIEFLDLSPHVIQLRSIKQEIELNVMKKAIKITCDAITQVRRNLKNLKSENDIEAVILSIFRKQSAWEAFESVVAAGANACAIHYNLKDKILAEQELIVIDIGAEVERYAADITRTLSTGSPKKRQRQVFQSVLSAQEYAMSLLKPGVILKDYEKQVTDFVGEQLRVLGLIKSITEENVRKYYPHRASHFIGLEPHDAGNYQEPLKPGMVLAVEPGIYILEEGLGVRLENDVLITEKGVTNLSTSLPSVLS